MENKVKNTNAEQTKQFNKECNAIKEKFTIQLKSDVTTKRTLKEDTKFNKDLLDVLSTPKQAVRVFDGMLDKVIDGLTPRQYFAQANIELTGDTLTLKQLFKAWPWKNEKGQLVKLYKVGAQVMQEGSKKPVYYFNSKTKKWESPKMYITAIIGREKTVDGVTYLCDWTARDILDGLKQIAHLADYELEQKELMDTWACVKEVATFDKVQNKGGQHNKPRKQDKELVVFEKDVVKSATK